MGHNSYAIPIDMKNILIPSDFSVQSLDCIKPLLERFPYQRVNLLLFHVFLLSDSISDLMLLARRRKEYEHISDAFWEACRQLECTYKDQINAIAVECFYGSTMAVFKNYLEGHQIDLIMYPEGYQYRKLGKNSCDPVQLIEKCGWQVLRMTSEQKQERAACFCWVQNFSYHLSLN